MNKPLEAKEVSNIAKVEAQKEAKKPTGLELLRAPFAQHQISKLPKPTKRQTEDVRADFSKGIRCVECGQWHHPKVVHLDYVGHAALTDRLLDCDPLWNWEPVAVDERGTPVMDGNGGMWIRLTVCGQTRLGYGHPDGKSGGNAIKEVIGDALRNAAMRFGAALDLWHKGDLHADHDEEGSGPDQGNNSPEFNARAAADRIIGKINRCNSSDALPGLWKEESDALRDIQGASQTIFSEVVKAKDKRKSELASAVDLDGDEIPY